MKNRIMNKLRSNKGASITFALLLFLVCAVLCSVIVAAASVAAGRMSKIIQNEEAYYAVTSAAEMMKKMIDGETVSLIEVKRITYDTPYTGGTPGSESPVSTETAYYLIPNEKPSDILVNHDFKASNAADNAFLIDSVVINTIPKDAAKHLKEAGENPSTDIIPERKLNLTSSYNFSTNPGYNVLDVTVVENMDKKGKIKLTLFNTYKSDGTVNDGTSGYTMLLEFGPDKTTTKSIKTEDISSTTTGNNTYTIRSERTEITIMGINWNLIAGRASL